MSLIVADAKWEPAGHRDSWPAFPQGRDVHVWSVDLCAAAAGPPRWLAPREVERAKRFVHASDARRYARAHLALRAIIGAYLGCNPGLLRFAEQAHGKPRLHSSTTGLQFNLSHSGDQALLAIGAADELGVDIEAVRADLPGPELAAAVLCAEELERISQLPANAQAEPFIVCWTRKEACLKALGFGLALEPRTLHVGLEPCRSGLRVAGHDLELASLRGPTGYCAALAALGGLGTVSCFDFVPGATSGDTLAVS